MRPEFRAVIFDLDDTLYAQRRFALSGFAAVARHLAARVGVSAPTVFARLCRACRRGSRGVEFQAVLDEFGLPPSMAPELVEIVRAHRPRLRLPRTSRAVLETLRPTWRIGVVTNGIPSIQAGKVHALGLRPYVDTVIFASEHGTGRGKPDPEPFEAALARLGVSCERAVFVGDNELCDIAGAAAVGLRTIRVSAAGAGRVVTQADATVTSLRDVPALVEQWVGQEWCRDVA